MPTRDGFLSRWEVGLAILRGMIASIDLGIKPFKGLLSSSLYANSFFLIIANVANAAFGFLFWTTAARLYSPRDVGLSAAAVSALGLVVVLSGLGLDYAVVRFLPHSRDPRRFINISLAIGGLAALVSCAVFIAGLGLWSPALIPLRQSIVLEGSLIIATISTTIAGLCGGVFLAGKQAGFVLVYSVLFGATRVVSVFALVLAGGVTALIGAWAAGTVLAAAVAILLLPRARIGAVVNGSLLGLETPRSVAQFAFGNYAATVLSTAPTYLLPLLIVNLISPEANAFYYIASSIGGLLAMIPTAIALSLFAHGSADDRLLISRASESLRLALWFLAPVLVVVWLLAGKILLLFGRIYAEEATALVRVLALATLPISVNLVFFSVRRVQQRMSVVVANSAWILCISLGLGIILLPRTGVIGAGVAWLAAQGCIALIFLGRHFLSRA